MSSSPEAPADAAISAIETRGLSKIYEVYAQPQDRLKQLLWPGKRKFFREFTAVSDVDLQIRVCQEVWEAHQFGKDISRVTPFWRAPSIEDFPVGAHFDYPFVGGNGVHDAHSVSSLEQMCDFPFHRREPTCLHFNQKIPAHEVDDKPIHRNFDSVSRFCVPTLQ